MKTLDWQHNAQNDAEVDSNPATDVSLCLQTPLEKSKAKIEAYLNILEDHLEDYDQVQSQLENHSRNNAISLEDRTFLGQARTIQQAYAENEPLVMQTREMIKYLRGLNPQSQSGSHTLNTEQLVDALGSHDEGQQSAIALLKQQGAEGIGALLAQSKEPPITPQTSVTDMITQMFGFGDPNHPITKTPLLTQHHLDFLITSLESHKARQYQLLYQQEHLANIFNMLTAYSLISFDYTAHVIAFLRSLFFETYSELQTLSPREPSSQGPKENDFVDYFQLLQRFSIQVSTSTPLTSIFRPPDSDELMFEDQELL